MLPVSEDRPLRWIFLDLNSYFAAAEQANDPTLRGKPVAVGAVSSMTGTIIAASYEAKAFGVKTGTKVGDALKMCPDIILKKATPGLYVHYHEQILEAVENVLPVHKVCSIDEMKFRLLGEEMERENAIKLAHQLKQAIYDHVAPNLTCSVGIAPSSFLAKVGTEFEKPNGLVVIEAKDLPNKLFGKDLTFFPGINVRTKARLQAAGCFDSTDLVKMPRQDVGRAFGSVIGERWWYLLQGYDLEFDHNTGKSLGHSNVLAPEFRNDEGCRAILLRLIHKACARLRASGFWALRVDFFVSGQGESWSAGFPLDPTQDTHAIMEKFFEAWPTRTFTKPIKVGVNFPHLKKTGTVTPSLFEVPRDTAHIGPAVDTINQKYGKNTIYLASIHRSKDEATEKIAFNKTWLFKEGKDDHVWMKKSDSEDPKNL
ncbi:MAG: hypothetical protein R2688_01125 [Fimbriimonadaceae bacterium]